VIGIGRGRREKLEAFVQRTGATYPIAVRARDVFDQWDVEVVPTTLLVGPDRKVVAVGLDEIERSLAAP